MHSHAGNLGWMTTIKRCVDSPITWLHPHVPVEPRPARTNSVSFVHTTASAIPQIPVHFLPLPSLLFIYHAAICSSIHLLHLSVHSPLVWSAVCCGEADRLYSLSFSLSLCLSTSVKKLNKELNQGHHLWLLCASMTSLSAECLSF